MIAKYADLAGSIFLALAFLAITIEYVADGKALKSAIFSPIFLLTALAALANWYFNFKST